MSHLEQPVGAEAASYRNGWAAGLALGALAISVTAFINLLSIEKSLLAIVLAIVAMRSAAVGAGRSRGRLALGIAFAHLVVATVVLVIFHDKLARLLAMLQSLG